MSDETEVAKRVARLRQGEQALAQREELADAREEAADWREETADAREAAADRRDVAADDREQAADRREAAADAREARLNARPRRRPDGSSLAQTSREAIERARALHVSSSLRLDRSAAALLQSEARGSMEQAEIDRNIAETRRQWDASRRADSEDAGT
ncbi:hypothetical protein DFR70_110252 [Nocardia tenerifensis]|uniref:Uncharacterized protein n=1 Tax=Nocardia tenerifensis TaxID=228006 RepID=A0A318JWJ1_9NOCA|nr:hypothetical protein DFR70_110252 [Nocardia tenerifensis]